MTRWSIEGGLAYDNVDMFLASLTAEQRDGLLVGIRDLVLNLLHIRKEREMRLWELNSTAQRYLCASCGGGLIVRDTTVECASNPAHQGRIPKGEAAALEAEAATTMAGHSHRREPAGSVARDIADLFWSPR